MNPYQSYQLYQAERPKSRAGQLQADAAAGQLAKAIAEFWREIRQAAGAAGRLVVPGRRGPRRRGAPLAAGSRRAWAPDVPHDSLVSLAQPLPSMSASKPR